MTGVPASYFEVETVCQVCYAMSCVNDESPISSLTNVMYAYRVSPYT
jgi:hypothetical protein